MSLPLLLVGWLAAAGAPGVVIEDRIDVVQVDRSILAVGATGAFLQIDLELGEEVLDTRSQGLIGVVTTTSRLLGVTQDSASFRELRYRVEERAKLPERIYLADRVALVDLGRRLAAMGPGSTSWNQLSLGPGEHLGQVMIGANLAGAVTERSAIAFATESGGFVTISLSPRETVESNSLRDSSLTLTTSRRFLVFRAGAGRWFERLRRNRF